jgi:chaperonin cofactor prefoldin
LQSLQDKATELGRDCATLELRANMHAQFLHKYETLDNMGFGLKELDSLWNTVNEIAGDNNIHPKDAITKFLSDVERQYNNKFESKVESLRNEINNLYKQEARLRTELLLLPLVGPKLVKLTQSGVSEQDIIDIAAVFEKHVAHKDRQSFISELEVYGSLKSGIQELSKQSEIMKIKVTSVQTEKRDLTEDNQRINQGCLRTLGSQNKSKMVVRDDGLIIPEEDEFADIIEMQENAMLVPLVKAARGEEVKVDRIKNAIITTLDLVIRKIGSDRQASYAFKNAKDMINSTDSKTIDL